ncbi:MAG: glycosyltransferase family 4 protein [Burkholderiales bacterium]|nr:glycosyltransferase family 4 protein [Burkholderiales bacterium]
MRIAMFADCYHPIINGVTTSIQLLLQALTQAGHEVRLFAPAVSGYRDSEPWVRRFASLRFPLHPEERVGLPIPLGHVREALAFRPDLVHLHTPFSVGAIGWLVAARLGCPRVFTHHTLFEEYLHYIPLPPELLRPIAVGLCRFFWNTSFVVVAPSQQVAQRQQKQGLRRPLRVIPTGVDVENFQGGDPRLVREELGLGMDEPILLYMGRLAREKSLEFLLEALARARQSEPRLRLLLVGDGPYRPELQQRAEALGLQEAAVFLGYRARGDLKHYLAASTLFVFASQTETQGLVLLEAQSAGVPVLALQASGCTEAVASGRSGLLVEPGDLSAFTDTLLRLLSDGELRSYLAEGALVQAQTFSISAMGAQMLDLYQQAASGALREGPGSGTSNPITFME